MKHSKLIILFSVLLMLSTTNLNAFAHVVVRPATAGIAAYQNFTISVPTEKDIPTISLRLLIPDTLSSVRPNVKPGWQIDLKKTGDGEDAQVQEIIWSKGVIPTDQRDEFVFSAKAPAKAQTIIWKAYQTYQDGSVVSWDLDASAEETEGKGPYSKTEIVDDLKASTASAIKDDKKPEPSDYQSTKYITYIGVVTAFISLILAILAYQKSVAK